MKRDLPPHIYRKGRKGHLWFVRRGWQSQRIYSEFPSEAFWAEYARVQKGIPPIPKGKTFTALIASYKRSDRFARLAPRTKSDYDKVMGFLQDQIGPLDPSRMQRKDIIRLQSENADAVRFANYCVQVIRILMEHAIDIGWREQNPAKGIRLIKADTEPRKPWPDDLIAKYRQTATGRALLVFELCIGTGQRIGDVLKMKWGDIEGDGINVRQNKTGATLWIPFTPRLRTALDAAEKRSVFILTNLRATGPWSYRGASQAIRKVRVKIGAENYDIHALRHTTTSELAALGLGDEFIMAVTGHRSAASVRHYSEKARQRKRALEAQKNRT